MSSLSPPDALLLLPSDTLPDGTLPKAPVQGQVQADLQQQQQQQQQQQNGVADSLVGVDADADAPLVRMLDSSLTGGNANNVDDLIAMVAVDPHPHNPPTSIAIATCNDPSDEAEDALDTILESSVADMDAALNAALNAVEENPHDPPFTVETETSTVAQATPTGTLPQHEQDVPPQSESQSQFQQQQQQQHQQQQQQQQQQLQQSQDKNTISTYISTSTNPTNTPARRSVLLDAQTQRNAATFVPPNSIINGQRHGRWTLDEKLLFLYGLQQFGKGRWKKISAYVPHRSLVQIKSHAQKVLQRHAAGDAVFRRLEEHASQLHALLRQTHERLGWDPAPTREQLLSQLLTAPTLPSGGGGGRTMQPALGKRRRRQSHSCTTAPPTATVCTTFSPSVQSPSPTPSQKKKGAKEQILAASVLCQLAGPDDDNEEQEGHHQEGKPATPPQSVEEANLRLVVPAATTTISTAAATTVDANEPTQDINDSCPMALTEAAVSGLEEIISTPHNEITTTTMMMTTDKDAPPPPSIPVPNSDVEDV